MNRSENKFIQDEMEVWGEDYILALLDKGYEPVLLMDEMGKTKWTWRLPIKQPLTSEYEYARMGDRRRAVAVSPVSATHGASE
jgi:hypothetical protein